MRSKEVVPLEEQYVATNTSLMITMAIAYKLRMPCQFKFDLLMSLEVQIQDTIAKGVYMTS